MKARRDQRAFGEARQRLDTLHWLEARGQLHVFYFDEAGVSLTSVVPYAWRPVGETLALPAFSHRRLNLLGFMSISGRT